MKGAGAIRPSDEHGGGGGGSPTAAKAAAAPPARGKKLSWPQLVGLTFFAVCGGDYGIEDSVGAAGPGAASRGASGQHSQRPICVMSRTPALAALVAAASATLAPVP